MQFQSVFTSRAFQGLAGLCLCVGLMAPAEAQLFPSFAAFKTEANRIGGIGDPAQQTSELDAFWNALRNAGQVPYRQGNQVAMLYRGNAGSINFPGDANGWSASAWSASRVGTSDLWMYETTLPSDARVDYKVVRSGSWILDPNNPLQQWSGFGPNSELRMPDYAFPTETVRGPNVQRGTLGGNIRLSSSNLGQDVNVRVYTPAGYENVSDLPVVYVTDGHEYADDRLGAMLPVLDNLIDEGTLQPTIAVFIDPRDPNTGANRRGDHYAFGQRNQFADFVAEELVPEIDSLFKTDPEAESRTILGTSLGGLFSAVLGARHPGVFENIAIQSPAFWAYSDIYSVYDNDASLIDQLDIFMEAGTINDGSGGRTMAAILARDGYDFTFQEVNEGHSWGHWKGQLDDALVTLVGPVPEPGSAVVLLTILGATVTRRRRR